MKHLFRVPVLLALAIGIVAFPLAAGAGHTTDPHTPNLVPRGHILEPASLIKQVGRAFCDGGQGDVVVFKNIVVRTWDAPASGTTMCGGQPVPAGFEGLHIFDISDKTAPELVGSVDLPCGSHTATGIPDRKNNRLLIYNGNSNTPCPWIDIVEVPLKDPGSASLIQTSPPTTPAMTSASSSAAR